MSVLPLSKPANPLQKYNFQWVTSGNNGNIYYNGNVGINTNVDPQYNLDVSGTSNISGDSLLRGNLTLLSDASFNGNLYVGQDIYIKNQKVTTGPSSQWTDNNGNIYYSGNVGINMNTNPTAALDVSGNGVFSGNTLSIGSDANGQIYVGDTNGLILQKNSPDAYVRNLQTSGKLYLGTQTTNSVTIDASNLNVAGTITANHNFKNISNLNLTNSNNRIFFVSNLGLGGYNNISSENSCGIFWGDSLSGGSVTNNFVIAPWKNSSLTEGIAITPSGNVGIRQSNPLYTLDVNGNLNVGQNLFTNASPILSYTTVPTLTTNQIGYTYFASVTQGILCSLNTPTLLTSIANIPQGIYIVSYAVQFNTFTALPLRMKTRVGITLHGIEVQGIAMRNITVNDYDGISGCITYENTSNNTFYLSIEVNQNGSCKTHTESDRSCYLSLTRIA